MVISDDLKEAIINAVNTDGAFGYRLFRSVNHYAGDEYVTSAYLDNALVQQTREYINTLTEQHQRFEMERIRLSREQSLFFENQKELIEKQTAAFDKKLLKQTLAFDEKLQKQSETLMSSFDEKLAKQTIAFDEKLQKQSAAFDEKLQKLSAEFDVKLQKQSETLMSSFDEKLAKQTIAFDEKLQKQTDEFDKKLGQFSDNIINFINRKLGYIGSRWGDKVEGNYSEFAKKIIEQWGGSISKWKRQIKATDDEGRTLSHRYEVDIVVTNGKILLIEMKMSCSVKDVERFIENSDHYMMIEKPDLPVERVMITFDMTTPTKDFAEAAGIKVILPD